MMGDGGFNELKLKSIRQLFIFLLLISLLTRNVSFSAESEAIGLAENTTRPVVLYAGTSNPAKVYRYTSDAGWESLISSRLENVTVESPHPYSNNYNRTWEMSFPAARVLRVHFAYIRTESGYDYIYLKSWDGTIISSYSGSYENIWSDWVPGSTVFIQLVSDSSITYDGFIIDELEWTTATILQEFAVLSLVEYNGYLYAGTMSSSDRDGGIGRVYRYDGVNAEGEHVWTMVGDHMDNQVSSLVVFRGELYAGTAWGSGKLYRYNEENNWTLVIDYPDWDGIRSTYVWNDLLYLGDIAYDKIGRYDGTTFEYVAYLGGSCIYDFEVYGDNLYAAAWKGRLYGSTDGDIWNLIIDSQDDHMWELETFQDYLYMGMNSGQLQRFNGETKDVIWTAPDSIISMVTYRDLLYIGTGGEAGYSERTTGDARVYQYDGTSIQVISDVLGQGIQVLYVGSTALARAYTLHVQSYPITGIEISYSGDYSGTGTTNFNIGPKDSPFIVTLTAPLAYQGCTFDHWELDGIPVDSGNLLSVEVSSNNWDRFAIAYYVREPSNINIYSEFAGYFFTGFGVNNTFYVDISYRGYVPISVNGMLAGETLVFNYNNTVGMWTATFNMGRLKPGKNVLMVTAVYSNGEIFAKSYSINVLQVPRLLLDIVSSGAINVRKPLGSVNFSISFIAKRTDYWNNGYQLIITLNISANLVRAQLDVPYVGGEYASPSLDFNLEFILSSSGEVSIGGELIVEKEVPLVSVPISIQLSAGAEGTFTANFYEYSVKLEDITVYISLSASGAYTLPTPLGISIQVGPHNINIGVTVELAAAVSGKVDFVFVPTDDRSKYFLEMLPLAIDNVKGFVGLPFILTGQIGAGGSQHGGRVGVWGWVQGVCGFGTFLQAGLPLLKGYALVGAVRAGITVKLIVWEWSGCLTLWSGSYANGDLSNEDLENLKGSINDVAMSRGYPPLGFDWINGSWTGIVAEDLPNGYSYTSVEHEDKTYVYYTYERSDGTAWISGYVFDMLNAYPASTPEFSGVGVASPFVFKLADGTPVMLWAAAPTAGDSGNLTIILQSSQMQNDVWTNPVNITDEGVIWAYTSDGRYIYAIWSPSITKNLYSNTVLRVFGINGSLLWERTLPGAMVLNGAVDGKVIVGFIDGTYSIISAEETINLGSATEAGAISEAKLMYTYINGTLRIFNQTKDFEIKLDKVYAWPTVADGKIVITTYTPGKLELYVWNGSTNIRLREYSVSNVTAISTSYAKGILFLFPYSFKNENKGPLWCSMIPLVAPEPSLDLDVHEGKATVSWAIKDPEQYNITKIELVVYHNNNAILTKIISAAGREIINLNQTGTYTFKIRVKTILDEKTVEETIEISPQENRLIIYLLGIGIIATVIPITIFYLKRKKRP